MNILDWIILAWLIIAFLTGARLGLVYRIGHIIGLVIGIVLAFSYGEVIASWFGGGLYTRITVILVMIVAIAELSGIVATLLDKFFRLFSWIPFAKTLNSILGGILGLVAHAIMISIALAVAAALSLPEPWQGMITQSTIGAWLALFGTWLSNFIPGFDSYSDAYLG